MPRLTRREMDLTCTIQMAKIKVKGSILGILTVYCLKKVGGPMQIHTQCVNRIRKLRLQEEPISVSKYQCDVIERMAQSVQKKGGHLVIGGDFNEGDSETSKMTMCMRGLKLEKASNLHGGDTPPTYVGGSKTIDHIWVSEEIVPLVNKMGYAPYNYSFHSDHRMSHASLDLKQFGKQEESEPRRRILNSKN